jgi:hypothetical protein
VLQISCFPTQKGCPFSIETLRINKKERIIANVRRSGICQITQAVGSGETERIAWTVGGVRRALIFLGILGAVLFALLFAPHGSDPIEEIPMTAPWTQAVKPANGR